MTAAHKLTTASPGETIELSRKARLGEKVTWQVSDWEKPAANDCCIREKTEAKVRWPSGQGLYIYVRNNSLLLIDEDGLLGYRPPGPDRRRGGIPGPFGSACGAEGSILATWIPDMFQSQCQRHDNCYGACGADKSECDHVFICR